MTKYNLGDKVWVAGEIGKVVGTLHDNILLIEFPGQNDRVYAHYESKVTPVAQQQFAIGDKVESFYTFKGRVVGFEEETNRVVCVSESAEEDDRRRYAYLPSEIKPAKKHSLQKAQVLEPETTEPKRRYFIPGNMYEITTREGDRYQVVCHRSTLTVGKIKLESLQRSYEGPKAMWILPERSTLDELYREDILTIKSITGGKR